MVLCNHIVLYPARGVVIVKSLATIYCVYTKDAWWYYLIFLAARPPWSLSFSKEDLICDYIYIYMLCLVVIESKVLNQCDVRWTGVIYIIDQLRSIYWIWIFWEYGHEIWRLLEGLLRCLLGIIGFHLHICYFCGGNVLFVYLYYKFCTCFVKSQLQEVQWK